MPYTRRGVRHKQVYTGVGSETVFLSLALPRQGIKPARVLGFELLLDTNDTQHWAVVVPVMELEQSTQAPVSQLKAQATRKASSKTVHKKSLIHEKFTTKNKNKENKGWSRRGRQDRAMLTLTPNPPAPGLSQQQFTAFNTHTH